MSKNLLYDVIVIGAGPAGGQCARELSYQGWRVLLVDRAKNFQENNYSSGGAPIEFMSEFDLPDTVVGTYWNIFRAHSTHHKMVWESNTPFGPIIDFDKLRGFLAEETTKKGGECLLSCQYQNHHIHPWGVEVHLKDLASSSVFSAQASLIVDATGSERKVLAKDTYDKKMAISAAGIEYHLEVADDIYQQYARSLNFFLGHKWMPQGYSWIFPMAPNKLKIGVIRYFQNKHYVDKDPSYTTYLQRLLALCGQYDIKDKHGKILYYTKKQKDLHYQGPVLAIGDAISSVNPLGWEGMRHAMVSGRLAARAIGGYLQQKNGNLISYSKELKRYFGRKWGFSEILANHLFKAKHDGMIDKTVRSFRVMSNHDIMQVAFHYRFRYAIKPYLRYCLSKIFPI